MLNQAELQQLVEAIRAAEKKTSGEIRVYVAKSCKKAPLERAIEVFKKLQMHRTKLRNAVLIFVSPSDRKAAIFGDKGIHKITNDGFWDEALKTMIDFSKKGEIVHGICTAISKVGELIQVRYPIASDDINELSDEIIVEA